MKKGNVTNKLNQTIKKLSKFILLSYLISFTFYLFAASPAKAASASFFTSGGGKVTTGQTITVTVSVNGSESYNAVEVNVNFANLTFLSATPSGGWTTFSGPSRSGSTVSYVGALFGSSATGSKNVLSLSFKAPSSAGTSTISASGTITVTNGNSKVSGGGNTATFTAQTPPPPPSPTPTAKPGPESVKVTSSTHSDGSQWYKSKDPQISWNKQEGVTEFSYAMDTKSDTTPDETSEGADVTKTFTGQGEGTSYFHIRAKNDVGWGPVTHFQINIDATAPEPFTITKSQDPETNEFILYFATNDTGSGIVRYAVKVDGQETGDQKSNFRIRKDAKSVTVTAYDKAGSSTESTLDLISSPVATIVTTTPADSAQTQVKFENTAGANTKSSNITTLLLAIACAFLFIYAAGLSYVYLKGLSKGNMTSEPEFAEKSVSTSPLKTKKTDTTSLKTTSLEKSEV